MAVLLSGFVGASIVTSTVTGRLHVPWAVHTGSASTGSLLAFLFVLFMMSALTGVRWNSNVVLIFISSFGCLCFTLWRSSVHFHDLLTDWVVWFCFSFVYVLDNTPLSDVHLAKNFLILEAASSFSYVFPWLCQTIFYFIKSNIYFEKFPNSLRICQNALTPFI